MALLYRAIWTDEADGLLLRAQACFRGWLETKYPGCQIPEDGDGQLSEGVDVGVDCAEDPDTQVFRAALHEDDKRTRWTTTLLAITSSKAEPAVWVDVEYVTGDDFFKKPEIAAPRLARDLIDSGFRPSVGSTRLRTKHRVWFPRDLEVLVAELLDGDRGLPTVVFSAGNHAEPARVDARARKAASRLAGVASVEILTPDCIDPFMEAVGGRDFGVWGGGARVYLPGLSSDDSPYRHFVLPASVVESGDDARAARIISGRLSAAISSRRAPACYPAARALLNDRGRADSERDLLDALADAEDARQQAKSFEELFLSTAGDLEEVNKELQNRTRQLIELRRLLGAEVGPSEDAETPDDAESCSAAASLVGQHLRGIIMPDGALRDLELLDSAIEARSWGSTAWRAFRALDAYSREPERRGFWQWCATTESPLAWPATSKKLSMAESETVMNNPRLRRCRLLPVDTRVDRSGEAEMVAHIKVAEGGGMLAPRIYFLDDTNGVTGKVHVGFFGPHRHMPNKSTN